LFAWLEPQGIAPHQAQRDRIQAFLAHRTLDEGIAARSLARQLTAIKRYHRWLLREGRRNDDPTLTVDAPRLPKPLPKTLSEAEVEALLNAPDTKPPTACATGPCWKRSMPRDSGFRNWWTCPWRRSA
jgi:integrase/recombinase XerD